MTCPYDSAPPAKFGAALEGERRQETVLVVDLKASRPGRRSRG